MAQDGLALSVQTLTYAPAKATRCSRFGRRTVPRKRPADLSLAGGAALPRCRSGL